MLQGKCPKCGTQYHGWALLNPRHQSCPRCGVGLEITDGNKVIEGYSAFNAEKLFPGPAAAVYPSHDKTEDKRKPNNE